MNDLNFNSCASTLLIMIASLYGIIGVVYGQMAALVLFFSHGVTIGGFFAWLMFGQIVAAFYGLLWPLMVFGGGA